MATAGRTVAVSGVTVAVALTSLMLFPETFLRSMGYGGVATVAVDMLAALTVLPALLAVLGPRVNALRIRRSVRYPVTGGQWGPARQETSGAWYRLAQSVMRRPAVYATVIVIVWIFQWGHLSGLLRFTPTGSIDPTMPILMLAIIFGLSMDYEVFLLSRIRERYDQTGDNTASVAAGLQRTGGLITSLALLLIIVVGAFSASGITFIKLTGVGMIAALIVDATIIRVLLVPATMRLLGRANWWAPPPLRPLYARYGIKEEGLPQAGPAGPVPVPADAKS